MDALAHARFLATRLDGPFWVPRLVAAATERFGAYVPVEDALSRAATHVAAGENAEVARLAALLELGPPRRAEAERLHRLVHGPTLEDLEWEAHGAELAALLAETREPQTETLGPEPATIETPASETIADATSDPLPFDVELGPLSDWSEEEIRADWRGMSATERRIFREAIEQAKGNVPDQLTAARHAHRKVLDHRLRRVA